MYIAYKGIMICPCSQQRVNNDVYLLLRHTLTSGIYGKLLYDYPEEEADEDAGSIETGNAYRYTTKHGVMAYNYAGKLFVQIS